MRFATLISALLFAVSAVMGADPLQGRWQINGGGALLDFTPAVSAGGALDIVWCDGPDLRIPQGAVIGSAVPSGTPGVYDCRILLDPRSDRTAGRRSATFRLTLGGRDSFSLEPYRPRRTVSLWRWLPYLFRVTVINEENRPAGLDGAARVGADPRFIVI